MRTRSFLALALSLGWVGCGGATDQGDASGGAGTSAGGSQASTGGSHVVTDGGIPNAGGASGGSTHVMNGGASSVTGGSSNGGAASGGSTANGGKTNGGAPNGGTPGDAGAAGAIGWYDVPLGDGSWNTEVQFSIGASTASAFKCRSTRFTMHFDAQGSVLDTLLGRDGFVYTARLIGAGSPPKYALQGTSSFPSRGDCDLSSVTVTELTLHGMDLDGDNVADSLEGTGKASGQFIQGDIGYGVQLSFELSGLRDTQNPSFLPSTNLHPIGTVSLLTTEPVTTATTVSLRTANGSIPLAATEMNGVFAFFSSPVVLPFGASFAIDATGTDLIGLPFASIIAPVTTLADPGLFAQDGFESPPNALLSGSARVVSAIGSVAALSGARSLFVPPLSSATLHLKRASGALNVRFSAQAFSSVNGVAQVSPPVQVAVIGGSVRVAPSSSAGTAGSSTPTDDSEWGYAGPKQELSVPLSESGAEIVVYIAPPGCSGFCPVTPAYLIDDLRVE